MKIISIKDTRKRSLFQFTAEHFFAKEEFILRAFDIKDFVEKEEADFVFFNVIKPVNGNDTMMSTLDNCDENVRLRVTIYKPVPFRHLIKSFFSLETLQSYIHSHNLVLKK